jgi:hypothetical protein
MRETALFVGWDRTHPGREIGAIDTYHEWIELLRRLEVEGEIEGFQTVLLQPHGGELDGFTLVSGEPEKLAALPVREDVHRLEARLGASTRS